MAVCGLAGAYIGTLVVRDTDAHILQSVIGMIIIAQVLFLTVGRALGLKLALG